MFVGVLLIASFLPGDSGKAPEAEDHSTPSFRNQVIPMMTKVGCNSGACHGALAGKGGFKLSLRGYDPATDHFVMTRQALGGASIRLSPHTASCCSNRRWLCATAAASGSRLARPIT